MNTDTAIHFENEAALLHLYRKLKHEGYYTHPRDIYELILAEWAKIVKARDKNKCQYCGSKLHLEAHHRKWKSTCPHLAFIVSNGVTVCKTCHQGLHSEKYDESTLHERETKLGFDLRNLMNASTSITSASDSDSDSDDYQLRLALWGLDEQIKGRTPERTVARYDQ